ncbi:hypothetical protein LTR28_004481, partial [Elasticomyces elasticus]
GGIRGIVELSVLQAIEKRLGVRLQKFIDLIDEICVWEAARSTSAAPGFFKPFSLSRPESRAEWIDGAVLHINPVEIAMEEARRVAETERLNPVPDIVLSIGTGLSRHVRELGDIRLTQNHIGPPSTRRSGWIRSLFTMVSYQIKLNTDADRRWAQVLNMDRHVDKLYKYRINPDLGMDPPELYAVDQVPELASLVPRLLQEDAKLNEQVTEVSSALVASSFYFKRNGAPLSKSSSSTEVHGWICCRLENRSDDIGQLGKFIARSIPSEFIIYNDPKNSNDVYLPVPLDSMVDENDFTKLEVKITISGDDMHTIIALRLPGICRGRTEFPISGFPRQLMKTDFSPH